MKTWLFLIFLFPVNLLFSQPGIEKQHPGDPFLSSISKIFCLKNISYEASSKIKALFETDTTYSQAKVTVKKQGNAIIFLNIVNFTQQDELLLFNDSVWYLNHSKKEKSFIGIGIKGIEGNYLSEHFPVSIFTADTLIYKVDPFWRTIRTEEFYDLVSIDIATKPEEASDLRVEILIRKSDRLIYSIVQDVGFKGITSRLFQEETFRNYTFPPGEKVTLPSSFNEYARIIPVEAKISSPGELQQDSIKKDIILQSAELFDLEGNPFSLPEDGLIFLDLWYAGCYPCMRAAPVIEKLYNKYKDTIYFFSINEIDHDLEKIRRFKDEMGITFPVLLGSKEKLAVKINGRGAYPLFIIMDAESGKVLWKMEGYTENLEKLITDAIHQNL